MFKWNQPTAKARGLHPTDGRPTIVDVAPIEIVKSPNRRQLEEIINALCMVVSELVELQEIQAARILEVQKMIANSGGNDGKTIRTVSGETRGSEVPAEATTAAAVKAKRKGASKKASSTRV